LKIAFDSPDYVIISTPTNFNEETNYFDTDLVELIVKQTTELAPNAVMIIKSTIPVGLTVELSKKYQTNKLYFSPEFLREGKALFDNLYPSRIIVGGKTSEAKKFADLLVEGAEKEDIEVLFVGSTEAEAIKLFSNSYLAMRVSYFNEIDSFSIFKELDAGEIIKGVSLDPRIGDYYNNPSFGYGGYCLPKDTKQMRSNFNEIPQNLMDAIIDSNETRKRVIADQIISKKPKTVGIYRLIMKTGSDNFRESAIFDVMKAISEAGIEIIVYEPELEKEAIEFGRVIKNLDVFKS
jgi:UDPglucose 6-dehydrogenase